MSNKNESLKQTITKMVLATSSVTKGKKATGTKISTLARDIPIIVTTQVSL